MCIGISLRSAALSAMKVVIVRVGGKIAFKLVSESTNLIIGELVGLLAGETFEVVFGK